MKAIITCVNYADILVITLPTILQHFSHVTVVTDLHDIDTWNLARDNVSILRTDSFYKNGSVFNKGAAMDEALVNANGWTGILDADIYLPTSLKLGAISKDSIYTPHRRIIEKPGLIPIESEWKQLPRINDREPAGYFQLFNTESKYFGTRPWYESKWTTAQGCDSVFSARWPRTEWKFLKEFEVLHLGPIRINWEGRKSEKWTHHSPQV